MCDVICNEAVPFRPYCAGVATRTRNVSEYMLVLALCLVVIGIYPAQLEQLDTRRLELSETVCVLVNRPWPILKHRVAYYAPASKMEALSEDVVSPSVCLSVSRCVLELVTI